MCERELFMLVGQVEANCFALYPSLATASSIEPADCVTPSSLPGQTPSETVAVAVAADTDVSDSYSDDSFVLACDLPNGPLPAAAPSSEIMPARSKPEPTSRSDATTLLELQREILKSQKRSFGRGLLFT